MRIEGQLVDLELAVSLCHYCFYELFSRSQDPQGVVQMTPSSLCQPFRVPELNKPFLPHQQKSRPAARQTGAWRVLGQHCHARRRLGQ
ncbi:hypothetical protein LR48_Vigan10g105300 [Vigna angularis]|uniref:Uncharacterized protein n=1 Tax=Phaseolus angularis TaxID=3914 RepID=A0A0L9VJD7_PHAAN|nr:hypothetical protein LR48_Vigan10g105300 [Vigna angularis]